MVGEGRGVAGWNIGTNSNDVRLGTLLGPEEIPVKVRVSCLAAPGLGRLTLCACEGGRGGGGRCGWGVVVC